MEDTLKDNPTLSVVVPVYNEEESIPPLYRKIREVCESLGKSYEIVFVDDGSRDRTFELLERIHRHNDRVKVIRFRKNYGQTAAMAAGFKFARGDVIVSMDGDLQNDPADIPLLLSKLEEGYDLANGWRVNRQDSFLSRRLPSKIANRLISFITGVYLHDYGCSLKALRRDIAKELKLYGEMHRFIPALAADLGAAIAEVPVHHHPRRCGRSKYGLSRTLRVFVDLMTVKFLSGYSTRPGHLFGLCGVFAMLGGLGITFYLGILRLFHQTSLANRPLLLLGILLIITGVQFITMGLLGEMLSRVYYENQEKPTYTIKEILSSESPGTRLSGKPIHRVSSLPSDRVIAS
ncbi:MAG: glycosyltransferase family 2 protein [Deltaproteobacteria bacterium]|nr:glycosyltransferase family 2 protein [Deltaproteobacteria bacterium]